MGASARSPSTAITVSGVAPNHRPSGAKPFVRIGSPQACSHTDYSCSRPSPSPRSTYGRRKCCAISRCERRRPGLGHRGVTTLAVTGQRLTCRRSANFLGNLRNRNSGRPMRQAAERGVAERRSRAFSRGGRELFIRNIVWLHAQRKRVYGIRVKFAVIWRRTRAASVRCSQGARRSGKCG
jgi:hypothetical protein